MSDINPIIAFAVVAVGLFLAWKLLAGLTKTAVLVVILAVAAWYAFGVMG